MRYVYKVLLVSAIAAAITAYVVRLPEKPLTIRYDNIERVMMGEAGHYTFLVRSGDALEERVFECPAQPVGKNHVYGVRLHDDIPPDSAMWASCTRGHRENGRLVPEHAEIHIRAISDIEGGGWNHGKFGSGRSSVVR